MFLAAQSIERTSRREVATLPASSMPGWPVVAAIRSAAQGAVCDCGEEYRRI